MCGDRGSVVLINSPEDSYVHYDLRTINIDLVLLLKYLLFFSWYLSCLCVLK